MIERRRAAAVPQLRIAANGTWYVHWSEGRRSKRASLGTKDEGQARTRFAQWLLLGGGKKTGVEQHDYTVKDAWLVYDLKHVQTDDVTEAWKAATGFAWKNLQPHFGLRLVQDVTQDVVDDYAAKRAGGRLGRRARPATIRREVATLVAALNFCGRSARLYPKALIEEVSLPKDSPPRDRWLKMDEMQRLLTAAGAMRRGERLSRGERFLWLALFTAGRKQALLELTWDRVDFETNTIHLNVPGRRITKKRRADVTIAAQLKPVLERAFAERESKWVLDSEADIWATVQFTAIRAGFSDQKVKKGQKPKSTGISPHVLRHTAATHMARRGVPLWMIANVLGNTLAMTERVYAKWVPENPAGTVDMISGGVLEPAE